MSPRYVTTVWERYDQALHCARLQPLPPGLAAPHPTRDWSLENISLLESYAAWLSGGGASQDVIRTVYIPMAGHVLGLNLKPSTQLDLQNDLQKAMDYVLARKPGIEWAKVSHMALERFRRFLLHSRGQIQTYKTPFDVAGHTAGLPEWLVQELTRYQQVKQRNWREARIGENQRRFWSGFILIWRYLCEQRGVRELKDVRRQYLYDFADERLAQHKSPVGINNHLRSFHGFMTFLQDSGYEVPQALLNFPCLKEPDSLPKYMTDEQVKKLRDDFELQVRQAENSKERRDALLDRAVFYLLWQGGMRRGEVEELRLEDLELGNKKITIRHGKSLNDRTVYLTFSATKAVAEYLLMRGVGPTDHVFLYRNQPLSKDLINGRLQAAGQRVGVKVYSHRLRHTCATQLLNAGCRITSIQKFLGHKKLNSTMIYARVYDQTVADDYYMAMNSVEKRLELLGTPEETKESISETERGQLLTLSAQLEEPELSVDARLAIATQIRLVLAGNRMALQAADAPFYELLVSDQSPPVQKD